VTHNDALDYAERLYSRVPAHYRVYDAERGEPLRALLRIVGEQVAVLRQDLDALWDNFFIETCDDWVVPFLGSLVGTNLLPTSVGLSDRLDVRNTIAWRRSKGTPAMLRALATAISGWPTDLAEFFQTLGWSQNVNHLRLTHPLTPDLRDVYRLSLLGRAADPLAHAVRFTPARPLDQPRVARASLGVGRTAWGTPGRYQIKTLGFFVRRLQTFMVSGATPAAAPPGRPMPLDAACFTFDPLFRESPLFVQATAEPLSRARFNQAPASHFGADVGVRQFGVLLASDAEPVADVTASRSPFTFGGVGAGFKLHPTVGLRLPERRAFELGAAHFVLEAVWVADDGSTTSLGALSTLRAARGEANAFRLGSPTPGAGHLALDVHTGRAGLGWPGLPSSPTARFPGAALAIRGDPAGAWHLSDAVYAYLPAALVRPSDTLRYHVAEDGATFGASDFNFTSLARASDGQVFPSRSLSASVDPAAEFVILNRAAGGLRLLDPARFGGTPALVEVNLFTGAFQPLGAIATVDQAAAAYPDLRAPDPWPALTHAPSRRAIDGDLPDTGLLSVRLKPLAGDFLPASELVVVNRAGKSLLVYLPEVTTADPLGVQVLVATDGSTYFAPADDVGQLNVLQQGTYSGLPLARHNAGQVLPMTGVWPLQQRQPVALDLCRCERRTLLLPGELGVDPELGRFAFAPGDPALPIGDVPGDPAGPAGGLSVDYVEAFADRVGARTFDRQLDPSARPTRLVAWSGDARTPLNPGIPLSHVHRTVADALANAADNDVIEIVDSATYAESAPAVVDRPGLRRLQLRAANRERPCLAFYRPNGSPTHSSLRLQRPVDRLELNGLLLSGGPVLVDAPATVVQLVACTFDPLSATAAGSLVASDVDPNSRAEYLVCRCISGGLRLGQGVGRLTVADSIVDAQHGLAIGGLVAPGSTAPDLPASTLQLERVTVLGRLRCDVLTASECLLDHTVLVNDQQAGCLRFSRWEVGSVLPRRYACVPTDDQVRDCRPTGNVAGPPGNPSVASRCLPPMFNALRFGRPDYAQLASEGPAEIATASESGAEVGAFASRLMQRRLDNLRRKLEEFMPLGLEPLVIAET
jgi:hypothetical protein